ncbi:hypothetical protein JCM16303_003484 [Sporobolomyces ruberrimus]
MSSFDQSRGFGPPSSLTRQDTWSASDGWGGSHASSGIGSPPPPINHSVPLATSSSLSSTNGFQQFASVAANDLGQSRRTEQTRELDYSVIDSDQGLVRTGGFTDDAGEGQDLLSATAKDWKLPEQDKVSVHLSPQLEGTILQRHHVWVVVSGHGKSSTERRYSDFVWLLDCLTKRYPFRLLPSLPPKSIQYQGHFIGQDEGFLERRKRGLERCLNSLVNHPVLSRDAILNKFLNDPNDLTSYRKSSSTTLSLSEESTTLSLSSNQISQLPRDLETRFQSLRSHLPVQIESWTRLSVIVDRIAHRRKNQANEWEKFAGGLEGIVTMEIEVEAERREERNGDSERQGGDLGWRPREMKVLERELGELGKSARKVGEEEEESSKRLLDGWVEDVKRHRELYLNLRDLFHRQVTMGIDHLDKLEKRLSTNISKLELLQSTTPPPPNYSLEFEKLSTAIEQDKRTIEQVKRRREFIRWSVWTEINWVFRSTSLLRRNIKSFVESERRFGSGIEGVWNVLQQRGLGDESVDV